MAEEEGGAFREQRDADCRSDACGLLEFNDSVGEENGRRRGDPFPVLLDSLLGTRASSCRSFVQGARRTVVQRVGRRVASYPNTPEKGLADEALVALLKTRDLYGAEPQACVDSVCEKVRDSAGACSTPASFASIAGPRRPTSTACTD